MLPTAAPPPRASLPEPGETGLSANTDPELSLGSLSRLLIFNHWRCITGDASYWSMMTKKEAEQFQSLPWRYQFSSVQSLSLCDPMNRSTPGLPVHHQLPEFSQTLVHRVGDAIQPSHPLSSPSPPAPNPSQHQSLFQ